MTGSVGVLSVEAAGVAAGRVEEEEVVVGEDGGVDVVEALGFATVAAEMETAAAEVVVVVDLGFVVEVLAARWREVTLK